jgi:hypothetical protein
VRHDTVLLDIGDETDEVVARGFGHRQRRVAARHLDRELRQSDAIDQTMAARRSNGLDPTPIGPAPDRVDADTEEFCGLPHLVRRHGREPYRTRSVLLNSGLRLRGLQSSFDGASCGRGRAYAPDVIAHRQTRVVAAGSVLLAFIGLWVGHTLEYLRVWGGDGLVSSMTNPVHAYMLPLAGALVVLSALFALRLWCAWQALNTRLEQAAMRLRRVWRGGVEPVADTARVRPSPGAHLLAIWLPLAAAQIVLYVVQENVEAIAGAKPAPGLGVITGIHWAAPLVHLYVALLLACGTRICQILLHRRTIVVERIEALVRAAIRRRRAVPKPVSVAHEVEALSLFDRLGRDLWRRPPPLLLDI